MEAEAKKYLKGILGDFNDMTDQEIKDITDLMIGFAESQSVSKLIKSKLSEPTKEDDGWNGSLTAPK